MLRLVIAALLIVLVAGMASAQDLETSEVAVFAPSGWTLRPDKYSGIHSWLSPDRSIRVTVYARREAVAAENLEGFAHQMFDLALASVKSNTIQTDVTVERLEHFVKQEGGVWVMDFNAKLSSGYELKGRGFVQNGGYIYVGAESKRNGQAELEAALKLFRTELRR